MDSSDAARLIGRAVLPGQRWADLGAGRGTFTTALARLLGPTGTVYAIERDPSATRVLDALARDHDVEGSRIVVVHADFTQPLQLPLLDGALLANALHFVQAELQADVVRRIVDGVGSEGSMVIVEYDNRPPSRWVPFPVSLTRLAALAAEARLEVSELIGRRRSAFGGNMYAARLARRP